ncbi:Porin O precursor [Candidatus Arcanobacter lacustris]|uniref:Porin O n=1 Tax=Candidatus Arcanibacter lacustris TaxID=1607817 RepID=A0A0F5MMX6_9RICK|nr:Porin O precursor [Candidatus Arcanobacter lacustris]KKB96077.1 Porin O precursor [Candidatus Arcanobacter lacustris]
MNKYYKKAIIGTALISSLLVSTAFADDHKHKHHHKLDHKLKMLEEKIAKLEHDVEKNQAQEHKKTNGVKFSLVPGPKFESEDGKYSLMIGGYVMNHWGFFSGDKATTKHRSGSTMKNARISISGNFGPDWSYKLENNFVGSNNTVGAAAGTAGSASYNKIGDAYIAYSGIDHLNIKVGQMLEPISLDWLRKPTNLAFFENALISNLAPGKELGFALNAYHKYGTLTAGFYGNNAASGNQMNQHSSFAARATLLPIHDENSLVHFAVSGNVARPEKTSTSTGRSVSYSSYPATQIASKLVTASIANVTNTKLLGYETALMYKNFSLIGEYLQTTVSRTGNKAVKFKGHYIQAGWVLTGEKVGYDAKSGALTGVTPANSFDLKAGHWGAVELVARYNYLDLNDRKNNILGGSLKEYDTALNWYANNYVKLSAQYSKIKADKHAVVPNNKYNAYLFGAQFAF